MEGEPEVPAPDGWFKFLSFFKLFTGFPCRLLQKWHTSGSSGQNRFV
jgi:hypothetical protein